jgi:YVTN family beta-propeller protein
MAFLRRVLVFAMASIAMALPATAQTRVYALQSRYLHVLDGSSFQQLARLDLVSQGNPTGIAVTGNGTRAYIGLGGTFSWAGPDEAAAGAQPRVAIVDLLTMSVVRQIAVGAQPIDVVASPAGDRVYVANLGDRSVSVIRTSDDTVIATVTLPVHPSVLAVSSDGSQLYAAGSPPGTGASTAYAVSTSTFVVGASYPAPGCAQGLAVSRDGTRLYVSGVCSSGTSLFAYDTTTGTRIAAVGPSEGQQPVTGRLTLTSDGTRLIAGGGTVNPTSTIVWDTATMTQIASATPTGSYVALDPSETRAFTWGFTGNASGPNTGRTRLTALDLSNYSATTAFDQGSQISGTGLAVAPAPSTAPTMALDKTSLNFGAVSNGAAFTSQTPAQTIRLRQSGAGAVTWTATSTAPWLVVSPASGSGPAMLSISIRFAPGLTDSQTGSITVALTGASNTVRPVEVRLTTVPAGGPASPPFGIVDTPAGDSTVLAGSVAVTGWTLDNIGVKRVELWRDLQAGETTPPFSSTPTDPRNGKVFIASPTFVDGARPDIEALYASTPANYRGGWGYLMLTWGLWNQGNGTYRLSVFAFDQEDNVSTIGTKTIVVNNNAATKPFGSIDTPAVGGDASGANFGWALTPKVNGVATCKIPSNGVQVSIDSGPLQPVVYGDARSDIAAAFPGFSNSAAAGGHYIFDWSTLTNGVHTIGWLVTDDCNRADGIGSRFFNVANGVSALTASPDAQLRLKAESSPDAQFRLKAETSPDAELRSKAETTDPVVSAFRRNRATEVLVSRGYGELSEIVTPDDTGDRSIDVKQGERIEIRLPRAFASAYQVGAGGLPVALPTGSTWDEASGIFYWQPAPAFLGRYRLVFSNGSERISVGVVVRP